MSLPLAVRSRFGARLLAPVFGHVGNGNFHCLVLADPRTPEAVTAAGAFSHRLVHRALRHGGTSTGEYGAGLHKMQYLVDKHGAHTVALMRATKQALDPHNIFSPGKVASFNEAVC